MDDWNKILVYGSFDGFAYSTDDFPLISVVLGGGEKAEIPAEFVVSADQMVNKNKIKLKDVIARIQMFDLETKVVWLNEILNELGSDYGTLKYKAGYEQGKFDGAMERAETIIPQIVADYIKYAKEVGWDLLEAMKNVPYEDNAEFRKWFYKGSNVEVFAAAWVNGFHIIEKEKRYIVKIKGLISNYSVLKYQSLDNSWFMGGEQEYDFFKFKHTRKELEEAGFGEVFNSPLFEVEEVEGQCQIGPKDLLN